MKCLAWSWNLNPQGGRRAKKQLLSVCSSDLKTSYLFVSRIKGQWCAWSERHCFHVTAARSLRKRRPLLLSVPPSFSQAPADSPQCAGSRSSPLPLLPLCRVLPGTGATQRLPDWVSKGMGVHSRYLWHCTYLLALWSCELQEGKAYVLFVLLSPVVSRVPGTFN